MASLLKDKILLGHVSVVENVIKIVISVTCLLVKSQLELESESVKSELCKYVLLLFWFPIIGFPQPHKASMGLFWSESLDSSWRCGWLRDSARTDHESAGPGRASCACHWSTKSSSDTASSALPAKPTRFTWSCSSTASSTSSLCLRFYWSRHQSTFLPILLLLLSLIHLIWRW